jgi:peptidoglycan/xylan/chitin deacetylase (PgdA/CDA1 family)
MPFFRIPWFVQQLFPNWIWRGSEKNALYLTFDDGPGAEHSEWILSFLREQNIKATFFCVGEASRNNPLILNKIISEGHRIGNHTMRHEKGWKSDTSSYLNSVGEANAILSSNLFRPPYGRIKLKQARLLRKLGYKIIMWTWLSNDFDENVSASEIEQNMKKIKSGDIIVFHDNHRTFDKLKLVLPVFIERMLKRGYHFAILD